VVRAGPDLYGPLVLPGLDRRLQQEAPLSGVHVTALGRISVVDALATGEIDLYLGIPTTVPSAWHSQPAFIDDIVGVMAAHHPDANGVMTLEVSSTCPTPTSESARGEVVKSTTL